MRAYSALTVFGIAAYLIIVTLACEPEQTQNGCKIFGSSCTCGLGCKSEYIYRTRRACMNALKERSSNICYRSPCARGNCIQTIQDPGYTCKCEGTGYYGQRCEKDPPRGRTQVCVKISVIESISVRITTINFLFLIILYMTNFNL